MESDRIQMTPDQVSKLVADLEKIQAKIKSIAQN
jgi:hypothetical protein